MEKKVSAKTQKIKKNQKESLGLEKSYSNQKKKPHSRIEEKERLCELEDKTADLTLNNMRENRLDTNEQRPRDWGLQEEDLTLRRPIRVLA